MLLSFPAFFSSLLFHCLLSVWTWFPMSFAQGHCPGKRRLGEQRASHLLFCLAVLGKLGGHSCPGDQFPRSRQAREPPRMGWACTSLWESHSSGFLRNHLQRPRPSAARGASGSYFQMVPSTVSFENSCPPTCLGPTVHSWWHSLNLRYTQCTHAYNHTHTHPHLPLGSVEKPELI